MVGEPSDGALGGLRAGLVAHLLSNDAIIAMVGHEAYARGMVYARNGQVLEVQLDPVTMQVSGRVQGSYRDSYETSVRLVGSEHGWTGHRGTCSCPVRNDCKHSAALLIVARAQVQAGLLDQRPAWELALERMVREPESGTKAATIPLGLEFGVEQLPSYGGHRGRTTLRMRPVRWGSRGSWLRTGVSWDELDYPSRRHSAAQRDLLLQLRTAAGATARFNLPRSPWLPLTEVAAGIWTLLTEAGRVGLALIVEGGGPPPLITTTSPALVLDARRVDADVVLEPRMLLDGEPLAADRYGLLGDPVHGIYLRDAAGGLTLAQLSEPLSREQRRLLADANPIRVPAADEARFLTEYLPAVRRRAAVVSSDASVHLPGVAEPQLAATITFRPEHRVRLDWSVRYARDGIEHVFALDEEIPALTLRDQAAETALVARLPLPYEELPMLSAEPAASTPAASTPAASTAARPAAHVLLAAGDAAVFVDRVLPRLEAAGVILSFRGDPVHYRRPESEPVVEVSATPTGSADWFDLAIRIRLDGEVVPFEDVFVALSSSDDFLITDTGVYVELDRPEFARLRGLIDEARQLDDRDRPDPAEPGLRINRTQVGLWDELVDLGVVLSDSQRWLASVRALVDSSSPLAEPDPRVPPPDTLAATLRPYQEAGFAWLEALWRHDLGGVLADDMGLGKTVQTLALICRARAERPDGPPFLVVAPTSVVSNWIAEIARFAPSLRVAALTTGRRRQSLAERIAGVDLVVTSYALLRLDLESLAEQAWSGMILDEAQFVKNRRGRTYAAARRISTGVKIAITGTPVENNLMDLWSLFSLVAPGLFPHADRFAEYYRRPIERDHDAVRLAQLRRRITPFLLRRTKEAVAAELPPKQEQVVEVVLQPKHQRIYQTYLQRERQKVLGLLGDLDGNRFTILRSLTLLRQLSLDPVLVDAQHAGAPASKIDVLVTMLNELVGEGHSALVFSQFTGFLDRVQDRLDTESISYVRLDGRTRDRGAVIERFRSGAARVFLISLKAGGFGLNLTEADYCFVLDPWWNPAAEAQAVDRAHRIGQQRPVMVYRLVAKDTIEEKVMALKARKERLVAAVLSDDALGASDLGADEIREILELPTGTVRDPDRVSSS